MRKQTCKTLFVLLVVMLAACISGCGQQDNAPQAMEDEIKLLIQLDLEEDIGLLVLDNTLDGVETSGGISNADKSMLKRNDIVDWTISKQDYGNPADTADLSVRFRVITEYCEPNYDNDYPEEFTVLLDPISFKAEFGKSYHVTITGDKESGYQAALNNP